MKSAYSREELRLAEKLGTATLFESSNHPSCALDSMIKTVWKNASVAGSAYPVHCAPGDNLAIQVALELAPPESILVVTTENFLAGYWGEVLTIAAQAKGIKGLVIDGGVRDTSAIAELHFPVFSRGISVRGTAKSRIPSVGEPILMGSTRIEMGDLVVADDDGIVVIPKRISQATLTAGMAREEKEAVFMEQLKNGKSILDLMGLTQWSRLND